MIVSRNRRNYSKEEEEEEEENLFAQNTFTSNYKLAIGLSECNNIRKKLNKQDKYAMDPGSQVHLNIKKI